MSDHHDREIEALWALWDRLVERHRVLSASVDQRFDHEVFVWLRPSWRRDLRRLKQMGDRIDEVLATIGRTYRVRELRDGYGSSHAPSAGRTELTAAQWADEAQLVDDQSYHKHMTKREEQDAK